MEDIMVVDGWVVVAVVVEMVAEVAEDVLRTPLRLLDDMPCTGELACSFRKCRVVAMSTAWNED